MDRFGGRQDLLNKHLIRTWHIETYKLGAMKKCFTDEETEA